MDDSSDILYHTPTNVIIVPTTSHPHSHYSDAGKCKGCHSPLRRSSIGNGHQCGSGRYDPSNYLTRGGNRAAEKAAEEKLVRLNKAAMKDLQLANSTLASELVRLQSTGGEERQAMREEVVKLELLVQAQSEKIELLQGKLSAAMKLNEEAEEKHHARLKEVARRLKEEHLSKLKPLQDAHNQLLAELASKQEDAGQLLHARDQLSKAKARLEMESSSRAELWQRASCLEQELRAAKDRLAVTSKGLKQAEQQLEHASKVEQQLRAAEEALQSERVAHSKLQADATLERSQAAALKVEVDRLRRELSAATKRGEAVDAERSSLKLALADAQAAAADAGVEVRAANARAERLEQELQLMRQEADSQAASLRSQAAAREERLQAQAASKLAQLQSELDARGAAASDSETALTAARADITRLTGQVESLRHMGDAAGAQLAAAQSRVEQLKEQVKQMEGQLKAAQVAGLQREVQLSELGAASKASSAAWAEDMAALQEQVAKWRGKAVELQEELETRSEQAVATSQSHAHEVARLQVSLDNTEAELAAVRRQLAAVEEERTAAAKRSGSLLQQWEERDEAKGQELAALRSQVSELLEANDAVRCEAEVYRQQLRTKEQELESATIALADEQARLAMLRGELGALEKEKAAEVEARMRNTLEQRQLAAALQAEQQARLDAQLELHKSKKKQATIESQLQQQRIQTLSQVLEAKAKSEEAANAAAALSASERKAKQYRYDSSSMLSDYDSWVQGMLAKKPGASAGGTSGGTNATAVGSAGGGYLSSPQAARSPSIGHPSPPAGLSRSTSQLASPAQQLAAGSGGGQHADLDKYDRIAALLEGRAVGGSGAGSLGRSPSGKSISLSGGSLAASVGIAASPARPSGSRGTSSTGAAAAAVKMSPSRPSFR